MLVYRRVGFRIFKLKQEAPQNMDSHRIAGAQVLLPARLASFLWNRKERAEYFFNSDADMYGTLGETQIIFKFWVCFGGTSK